MHNVNLSTIRSLRESIEELVAPLETAQLEVADESIKKRQDGLDLIMSDLTMIALLLTNIDLKVSADELDFINEIRRAVYDKEIPLLNSSDYEELCREFLHIYPKKRLTIDQLPSSIRCLITYDQLHGTVYAEKARVLFLRFAEAMVSADQNEDSIESIILLNFKNTIYPPPSTE